MTLKQNFYLYMDRNLPKSTRGSKLNLESSGTLKPQGILSWNFLKFIFASMCHFSPLRESVLKKKSSKMARPIQHIPWRLTLGWWLQVQMGSEVCVANQPWPSKFWTAEIDNNLSFLKMINFIVSFKLIEWWKKRVFLSGLTYVLPFTSCVWHFA